ncbi:MAG: glucans biosynthesis glucosyltransferase MdoH [Spongiibacteraceae bacterium]|jgi:membrane glycosyltransferase|nr:glucans biosynthesis glucosyltransferase MdoH [Spongiibacteraceae bacterium]
MIHAVPPVELSQLASAAPDWRRTAVCRRLLVGALVLLQTLVATYFLLSVLPYHGGTWVEISLAGVFALLFAWISVGFWVAMLGFVLRCRGGDRASLLRRVAPDLLSATPLARTAIVMPIYHEPVARSLAGLRAVYRSLERTGELAHFDFYILSDSRDAEVWLEEQATWAALCAELNAEGRLFYRRRTLNLKHKSGNIADFLRRWGRRYRYMAVLDADSLMEGETLVRMVRLMQRNPRVGILQTSPGLINARTLFARNQQFASQLYGPLFSQGLAALQLGEAAFWGHNAVLRVAPFMAHCGLRTLPGRGLFSGPVLSHDFVEAAYMGRAGYEVWLEPELGGSYEESPPTLVDELTRDRRWSKGNLQHLWLLFRSRGLRFAHRMALINGIMAYLASPLWLLFLALTTVETARLVLWPIDYFPEPGRLFPLWPEWHPQRAGALVAITLGLLLIPKLLAAIDMLVQRRATQFGGAWRMLGSVGIETLFSALLAPIRMLSHSRYVVEALCNASLRWAGQNRSGELGWRRALLSQGAGSLLALAWAGFALWLKPAFFVWSLPVALPLILAAPIFVLMSRMDAGAWLRRGGWLANPGERQAPLEMTALVNSTDSAFAQAIIHPRINALQVALARHRRGAGRAEAMHELRSRCLKEGPDALDAASRRLLAADADSLRWLHTNVWRAGRGSPWSELLGRYCGAVAWPVLNAATPVVPVPGSGTTPVMRRAALRAGR